MSARLDNYVAKYDSKDARPFVMGCGVLGRFRYIKAGERRALWIRVCGCEVGGFMCLASASVNAGGWR